MEVLYYGKKGNKFLLQYCMNLNDKINMKRGIMKTMYCFAGKESFVTIAEPSLWTRPQLDEFKKQIRLDPESVLTIGRGEVVTVRVPTHEEGIFFNFSHDLSFR